MDVIFVVECWVPQGRKFKGFKCVPGAPIIRQHMLSCLPATLAIDGSMGLKKHFKQTPDQIPIEKMIERSLEVKLPTIWLDGTAEAGRARGGSLKPQVQSHLTR